MKPRKNVAWFAPAGAAQWTGPLCLFALLLLLLRSAGTASRSCTTTAEFTDDRCGDDPGDTRSGISFALLLAVALGVPHMLQGVWGFRPLAALLTMLLPSGRKGGGDGLAEAAYTGALSEMQCKKASWGTFDTGNGAGSRARRAAPSYRVYLCALFSPTPMALPLVLCI